MFHSTRIHLTLWYTLIIILISASFSLAIFQFTNRELHRFARIQRFGFERRLNIMANPKPPIPPLPLIDDEALRETRNRIIFILVGINFGIAILSAIGGYLLSGKTLQPIQLMLTKQEQFVANTSHELKTPITALIANCEVALRDKQMTLKDAKTIINDNLSVAKNLHILTNRLLELSKIEHSPKISKSSFSLYELTTKTIAEMLSLSRAKNITLNNQINKSIIIQGYEQNVIKQVIVIIIDNAIKFSPKDSKIDIQAFVHDHQTHISITDYGTGINSIDLPHIFDRFYQASSSRTKSSGDGFGLGLSIAKSITDTLHGNISVQTKIAKGTTFTVSLPIIN